MLWLEEDLSYRILIYFKAKTLPVLVALHLENAIVLQTSRGEQRGVFTVYRVCFMLNLVRLLVQSLKHNLCVYKLHFRDW